MLNRLTIICLLSLLISALPAYSQVDVVTQEIDGKTCYVHHVEPGHTLYAISRLYKVEIEDILNQNPDVREGLRMGQVLYIEMPEDADSSRWENPIDIRDGLLIHTVKKGETLFAISRMYKVDVNDILEENPGADSGLSKGQELTIPFNDVDEIGLEIAQPLEEEGYTYHTVVEGETLYGLSKKFDVSMQVLLDENPDLNQGLKLGQRVRIPDQLVKLDIEVTRGSGRDTNEYVIPVLHGAGDIYQDRYQVSMMLPFFVEAVDTSKLNSKERRLQEISLQIYRGAMMAFDSLAEHGLNAEIEVMDVQAVDDLLDSKLSRESVRNSHLVIGPLQRSVMNVVAKELGPRGVHMVCPVPQSNKILLTNPNLSKTNASTLTQMERLGSYVAREHAGDNIILLESKDTRDVRNTLYFQNAFDAEVAGMPSALRPTLKLVSPTGRSAGNVGAELMMTKRNVVIAPISDQSIIQDLLTKLGQTKASAFDIIVYGLEDWLQLDIIDMDYRERFHISVPASSHIDYTDQALNAFVKSYRDRFRADPGQYAFAGYDVALYYGRGLMEFGLNFPNHFDEISNEGLISSGFDLRKTGVESGFENTYSFLLRHEEYELKRVPWIDDK